MQIREAIDNGLKLVRSNPQHVLSVGFRCRLLSTFDKSAGSDGRRRRTELARLVVKKVLPQWESLLPTDKTPHHALDLSEKVLNGQVNSVDAGVEMDRLWAHCDDLSWRYTDNQAVIMVGYAAVQAVREALSDKHFGCDRVTDSSADTDVEPYDQDSSFCAAIAYSGGPAWEKGSDVAKRLDFWTWWLTTVNRIITDGA